MGEDVAHQGESCHSKSSYEFPRPLINSHFLPRRLFILDTTARLPHSQAQAKPTSTQ